MAAMILRTLARHLALVAIAAFIFTFTPNFGSSLGVAPAAAQTSGNVPGNWSGNVSDSKFWFAIRKGVAGTVTIPDKKAAQLVQSDGDELRAFRQGPMSQFGGWLLIGSLILIGLFYVGRGRIQVDAGLSGRTIERFNAFERFVHWLTASSFIILALTGLNMLYGKYVLPSLIGKSAFASLTMFGKFAHDWIAWAFILGIILMFFSWVRHNIPNMVDVRWLMAGGGMFSEGVHPPAKRFNAGQKIIFWLVIVGGASLSGSGLALLFPFEIEMFAATFKVMNQLGTNFPTELSPIQETQYALMWHGIMALVMIAIIIAHIYIGSLGMEGAFDAVGTGQVDINWANEHHNLWVQEMESMDENAAAPNRGTE